MAILSNDSTASDVRPLLALFAATLAGLAGCASDTAALGTAPRVAITHDDFALADANHDGRLSRHEANNYLVFVVFTAADHDADGRLNLPEWTHNDPTQLTAFRQCDANNDGTVTLSEAIAFSLRGKAALALMRQADRNRDGKLNRAEIDAYLMRVGGVGG